MNLNDIQRLHADGFLSAEQRDRIVAHYKLQDGQSKFVIILSVFGGLLVASGIILVIASNWDAIPRGVKLLSGLALMLGAHAAGWWVRVKQPNYLKAAEGLHLIGSVMFLSNIALIGQVYNLNSRAPNALLAWWVGIAPLAWILRSKVQHILTLVAFLFWLGMEFVHDLGWFHGLGSDGFLLFYPVILLAMYAAGVWLERTSYRDFASSTQRFGVFLLHCSLLPLTWGWHGRMNLVPVVFSAYLPCAVVVTALLWFALRGEQRLPLVWRKIWFYCLIAWLVLQGAAGATGTSEYFGGGWDFGGGLAWLAAIMLFAHCLVMVNVGLLLGSRYLINLGTGLLAIDVITAYIRLFGTMAVTGAMFIVSGIGLIVLGVLLEKRRRSLLRRMIENPTQPQP